MFYINIVIIIECYILYYDIIVSRTDETVIICKKEVVARGKGATKSRHPDPHGDISFSWTNFKGSFHGRLPWLRPIVQSSLVGAGAGFVRADAIEANLEEQTNQGWMRVEPFIIEKSELGLDD